MTLALIVLGLLAAVVTMIAANLRVFRPAPPAPVRSGPVVTVVIPARDEEATIEAAVRGAPNFTRISGRGSSRNS